MVTQLLGGQWRAQARSDGNCLVVDGCLSGLVDWGSVCLGDPAVDVQVAWSPLFTESSRARFLERLSVSDATIQRAKAMAIQQACAALPYYLQTYPLIVQRSWHKLELAKLVHHSATVASAEQTPARRSGHQD